MKSVEIYQSFFRMLFGKEHERYEQQLQAKHGNKVVFMLFHPFFAPLLSRHAKGAIAATDSRVMPDFAAPTVAPNLPIFLETHEAAADMRKFWRLKKGQTDPFEVTGGFPAPMAAVNTRELTRIRQENAGKVPSVVFMAASGIAPVQMGSFKDALSELSPTLAEGNTRVIIQCGYGKLGTYLHEKLAEHVKTLPAEAQKNVLLHLASTPEDSTRLFTIAAESHVPLAVMVKGSELARDAQQLNLHLIATGAVGKHEVYNIYMCLKNGLQVSMKSDVLATYMEALKPLISAEEFENIRPALEATLVPDLPEAVRRTTDYAKSGHIAPTNRGASLHMIGRVVSMVA